RWCAARSRHRSSTIPYTTLFRSVLRRAGHVSGDRAADGAYLVPAGYREDFGGVVVKGQPTRLTLTAGAAHNRDIADETDYAACRTIMLNASRNYSIASRFLPADRRRHVEALYALLRVGDDRVDVSHEGFDTALATINGWAPAARPGLE